MDAGEAGERAGKDGIDIRCFDTVFEDFVAIRLSDLGSILKDGG